MARVRPVVDDFTLNFRNLNRRLTALEARVPSRSSAESFVPRGVTAYRTTNQQVNNAATGTLTINSVTAFPPENQDDYWTVGQPTRLTAPRTGIYSFSCPLHFTQTGGFGLIHSVRRDGNNNDIWTTGRNDLDSPLPTLSFTAVLEQGSYVEVRLENTTGTNGQWTVPISGPGINFFYIGPLFA